MGNEEVKREWEQKLRAHYQGEGALLDFMFRTLESFSYRYLNDAKLATTPQTLLLESAEENMGTALKSAHEVVKNGVKLLAKTVPREQKPQVLSRLRVDIHELTSDKGQLTIWGQINWHHPQHAWESEQSFVKKQNFIWKDLQEFRKGFPLALEEVCELFL
jgi:hypothetical protein